MKTLLSFVLIALITAGTPIPEKSDNIEFVCMKSHKASNTCYFNFRIDGGKYTYVDIGCKKLRKREETIQKVKEGKLALSRNWKIECPEASK